MSDQMSTGSSTAIPVPRFSGESYQIWVVKMRSYLKSFGLWEFVDQDKQIPPLRANPTIAQIKQHEEEKMKKEKAVACLHSALTDAVFTSIMHLETAKEIWDELKGRYEGSERVRSIKLLTLKREFEILKMKESESVKDYSSKLSELVNQMRLYGETVEDFKVVEKMLISLPEKFEAKVATIEESCDLKKLTISEMISKLQAQEQRISMRSDDVTEGAFQARHKWKQPGQKDQKKQNFDKRNVDQKGKGKMDGTLADSAAKGKFPPCSTCKRTNHLSKDCWYKGKPQIQCNHCKKWGHREKFCRHKQNQSHSQPIQQANYTDDQPHVEDHLFMATQACFSTSKDAWYIDNGCTSHMARDLSLFTSLNRTDRTKVKLGNGQIVQAAGKGIISIHTNKGPKLIHDVLLIPDLDQNLLSVAQLLKKGYSLSFEKNCCIILDSNGIEIVKVEMCNNSFPLSLDQVSHSALVSKHDNSVLWHKRYGHFNLNALKYLQSNDMVSDMPEINCIDDVSVQGKTPLEAWSGIKPSVKHLKTFGSICYSHVVAAKRSKLDDKAEMGVLLGYATNSKGYRVFILQTKKLIISRDVQVDEDAYWDWENDQIQRSAQLAYLDVDPIATNIQNEAEIENEEPVAESDSPVLKTKSLEEIMKIVALQSVSLLFHLGKRLTYHSCFAKSTSGNSGDIFLQSQEIHGDDIYDRIWRLYITLTQLSTKSAITSSDDYHPAESVMSSASTSENSREAFPVLRLFMLNYSTPSLLHQQTLAQLRSVLRGINKDFLQTILRFVSYLSSDLVFFIKDTSKTLCRRSPFYISLLFAATVLDLNDKWAKYSFGWNVILHLSTGRGEFY
ncbi:hypothetical protein EZV62_028232 [Acer yangbiense]|uniref:Uncharacterized protein n=1 Tax=Acer yangbiense TaxID=1000413 RepID=A0A5C7GP65_9ROSI|nr:hypothetical protein EZV62_028232 [Acer yangbiense]